MTLKEQAQFYHQLADDMDRIVEAMDYVRTNADVVYAAANKIKEVSDWPAFKRDAKPPANKIDRGKVKALYRAGWKGVDIAKEMKCSKVTIYAIASELKAAGEIPGGDEYDPI